MRLDDLYPFWGVTHQQLLDTVEILSEGQLEYRPHPQASSIRDIVLQVVREERFWAGTLIAGYGEYRPVEREHPDAAALVESLQVAREITERVLAPFSSEGLRTVRTVPADPGHNRPETNMPVSRLLWHVLESELAAWGQIRQRLEDSRLIGPPRDARRN